MVCVRLSWATLAATSLTLDARTSGLLVGLLGPDKFGLKLTTSFIVGSHQKGLHRGNLIRALANDSAPPRPWRRAQRYCACRRRPATFARPNLERLVN